MFPLGPRLVTLLLYGSAARNVRSPDAAMNTLLITDDGGADADLFGRLAKPVRGWTAAGHPAPLMLTQQEWRASADAFPIEYEDIRDAHRILAGSDPSPTCRSMENGHARWRTARDSWCGTHSHSK